MIKYIDGSKQEEIDLAVRFLSEQQYFGLDSETTGLDPHTSDVLLISAGNETLQYVFNVTKMGAKIQALKPILESRDVIKILQNAKFDYKMFKVCLGITLENVYDTMLAEILLLKGRKLSGFGLDDLVAKYARIEIDKTLQKSFVGMKVGDSISNEQIEYAGADVQHLIKIFQSQYKVLKKHGMLDVADLEMRAVLATGDLEINGAYVNATLWKQTEETTDQLRLTAQQTLDSYFIKLFEPDMFGRPSINYNSPKQLLPALKTLIGTPAARLKNTSKDALKMVDHEIIDALLDYKAAEKRVSTYGEEFLNKHLNPKTGRIHSEFNQLGTDTGRYSSDHPNLQNIPAQQIYRNAFTATNENYKIIGADYSSMELRLLADLSEEPYWLQMFDKGEDAHSSIGSRIFKKPIRKKGALGPDDPGENPELRRPAKSLNFLVCYGGGSGKLSKQAEIPIEQARYMLDTFWAEFTAIKTFFDTYVETSIKARKLVSPYDKRLRWLDGFDEHSPHDHVRMRNMAMNFPMQSGNASITKKALVLLREAIRNKDIRITSVIHDKNFVV